MSPTETPRRTSPITTLRQFVRERTPAAGAVAAVERCELCGVEVAAEHDHLIEPANRKLLCACRPCAILFSGQQAGIKYKSVPRRIRFLSDFILTDGLWDGLMIPISIAFIFHSTPDGKTVALYPSPAGPTESLLTLDSWEEIVRNNPVLRRMEPDVEALLVNRVGDAREHYLVPIDECYKLVGLIRAHWRGLSGGQEVWNEIGLFFAGLKERGSPAGETPRA